MRHNGLLRQLCLIAVLSSLNVVAAEFEELGVPIRKAGFMGVIVGPGPETDSERLYFNFRQDGGKLFLVAVDPATDTAEQFTSPAGTGAWGLIAAPDGKIYLGTHEGPDPQDGGQVLVFDPKEPQKQIQVLGRPAASESYLWAFTVGPDQKLYAGTYPGAKLVSYDHNTGEFADHGAMDATQKYTRNLATGPNGKIYLGIGYGTANVVEFDPESGASRSILPAEYRQDPLQTTASVWLGSDGEVYASVITLSEADGQKTTGSATLKLIDGELQRVEDAPSADARSVTMKDGTRVQNADLSGRYELHRPDGTVEERRFTYAGDGAGLFIVGNGPLDRIYCGSYMPNEIAWFDPATGTMENPGNPSEVGGEIYSMLTHGDWLYTCSYPGAFLSRWDPSQPWNYGRGAASNPRGFGPLGPGHLRPRAMVKDNDDRAYIGSYPEYGMHGGSLAVWDLTADTLVENHRNLVQDQSISCLAYDATTGLLFGGTSIQGGGGTDPRAKEARFFAFDPAAGALKVSVVPVPGVRHVRALCGAGRNLFGIANGDRLFVYDMDKGEIIHQAPLEHGGVLDNALQLWTDGKIYALSSRGILQIDPDSYAVTRLAEYGGDIDCGMAMDRHGIYFGVREKLVRYNWSEPGTAQSGAPASSEGTHP